MPVQVVKQVMTQNEALTGHLWWWALAWSTVVCIRHLNGKTREVGQIRSLCRDGGRFYESDEVGPAITTSHLTYKWSDAADVEWYVGPRGLLALLGYTPGERLRIWRHHLRHVGVEEQRRAIGRGFAYNQLAAVLFAAIRGVGGATTDAYVSFVRRRRKLLANNRAHIDS